MRPLDDYARLMDTIRKVFATSDAVNTAQNIIDRKNVAPMCQMIDYVLDHASIVSVDVCTKNCDRNEYVDVDGNLWEKLNVQFKISWAAYNAAQLTTAEMFNAVFTAALRDVNRVYDVFHVMDNLWHMFMTKDQAMKYDAEQAAMQKECDKVHNLSKARCIFKTFFNRMRVKTTVTKTITTDDLPAQGTYKKVLMPGAESTKSFTMFVDGAQVTVTRHD